VENKFVFMQQNLFVGHNNTSKNYLIQVLTVFFKVNKSVIFQQLITNIEMFFQAVNKKQQFLKFIFTATNACLFSKYIRASRGFEFE
jgi:hypothetical protein